MTEAHYLLKVCVQQLACLAHVGWHWPDGGGLSSAAHTEVASPAPEAVGEDTDQCLQQKLMTGLG